MRIADCGFVVHDAFAVLVVEEGGLDADGTEPAGAEANRAHALREHLVLGHGLFDSDVGQAFVKGWRDGVEGSRVLGFTLEIERDADRLAIVAALGNIAVERLGHVPLVGRLGHQSVTRWGHQKRAGAAFGEEASTET